MKTNKHILCCSEERVIAELIHIGKIYHQIDIVNNFTGNPFYPTYGFAIYHHSTVFTQTFTNLVYCAASNPSPLCYIMISKNKDNTFDFENIHVGADVEFETKYE